MANVLTHSTVAKDHRPGIVLYVHRSDVQAFADILAAAATAGVPYAANLRAEVQQTVPNLCTPAPANPQ